MNAEQDDIMRSRTLPMTEAEFCLLPREIGWKYEYAHGVATVRPQHLVGRLRAPVTPRPVPETGCLLRPLSPADAPSLAHAFQDSFHDTVEYCDHAGPDISRAAEDAMATFFAGRRGAFHPASRLASPRHGPPAVVGAALIVEKPDGPFLDILFVCRRWQRRGLATALAGAAMNALHEADETHLGSAYNVGNAPSVAWHHKFGFVEQPSFALARARAETARHELRRRAEIGGLTDADRAALEGEAARWESVVEALAATVSPRAAAGARGLLSPA